MKNKQNWLRVRDLPYCFFKPVVPSSDYLLLLGLVLVFSARAAFGEGISNRPTHWAKPITLNGVTNLYQVSEVLYRSAQPTREGFTNLAKMGIKTVVNLRWLHSDSEMVKGLPLNYAHIPMQVWNPEKEDLFRFLQIVLDTNCTPVLVHCEHGADRTGVMCAAYRVIVQGWSKEEALREMYEGGFGVHRVWRNLPKWLKDLNEGEIRQRLGLATLASSTNSYVKKTTFDVRETGSRTSCDGESLHTLDQPDGGLKTNGTLGTLQRSESILKQ